MASRGILMLCPLSKLKIRQKRVGNSWIIRRTDGLCLSAYWDLGRSAWIDFLWIEETFGHSKNDSEELLDAYLEYASLPREVIGRCPETRLRILLVCERETSRSLHWLIKRTDNMYIGRYCLSWFHRVSVSGSFSKERMMSIYMDYKQKFTKRDLNWLLEGF